MSGPLLDHGAQAERTRLAWSRTAMAAAAVGALLTHTASGPVGVVAGVVTLLCAAGLLGCGVVRYRFTLAAIRAGVSVVDSRLRWWTPVLAVLPGVAAVIALAATFLS